MVSISWQILYLSLRVENEKIEYVSLPCLSALFNLSTTSLYEFSKDKQSSLFCFLASNDTKKFYNIDCWHQYYKTFYIYHWRLKIISCSVCSYQAILRKRQNLPRRNDIAYFCSFVHNEGKKFITLKIYVIYKTYFLYKHSSLYCFLFFEGGKFL